ncbi:MAG: hypothetical protein HQK99_08310 [Nitrospirae bacterium]|nr:hypothetical protein [Nitrospirota bacterium]
MNSAFELKAAHYIRGRLRLKVETCMDIRVFFVFLRAAIKSVKEIRKAQLNRFAASVTLYFDDSGSVMDDLITKLGDQMDFIISLSNFTGTYEEILNAARFGEGDDIEIIIKDGKISINYLYGQATKETSGSTVFKKDTVFSATTISASLLTLLLAPGLPTPAWLVLLIFGYSSLKQYESNKVMEQLLVESLKSEKPATNG